MALINSQVNNSNANNGAEQIFFNITPNFDSNNQQKITIDGIDPTSTGFINLSMTATKEEYEIASYAWLSCIEQGSNYIKIISHGIPPVINLPCVITLF